MLNLIMCNLWTSTWSIHLRNP